MDEIQKKLYELVDIIKNNSKVINMQKIKQQLYLDNQLSNDLKEFHKISQNKYSKEYVEIKRKILNNEKLKEYKGLENELYFTVLEINKRLKSLIDRKKC